MRKWMWRLMAVVTVLVLGTVAVGVAATRYVTSGPIRDADITLRYPSRWQDVTKKVIARKHPDEDGRQTRFVAGNQDTYVTNLVAVKIRPVVNGFFTDLDDFRIKNASLYYALPGDDPADYARYSDHTERTQQVGKRTAYRVDVTTRNDFEDGTSAPIRSAELWIPRTATSTVYVRVQAADDAAGRGVIDTVMRSVRPA
jgi:hypothetical protein